MSAVLEFVVPIKATNSLNARLHWATRAREAKKDKAKTTAAFLVAGGHMKLRPLLRVTLVRVGPRALDGDNLQGALKAVRDAVAGKMGVDDGGPLVEWAYAQERGDYAVKVRVELLTHNG